MDSIVNAAVSEISCHLDGVFIKDLWPRLQSPLFSASLNLCNGVKTAIWNRILNFPGFQFISESSSFSFQDPAIQSFQDAEELNLKIVAENHLRECFLGLYDANACASKISLDQRRWLERIAVSRRDGITQSQLGKELRVEGNRILYNLKQLEVRGLIAKQPTLVKTKENVAAGEDGPNLLSSVNTNLIHLRRYTKHLNSLQRFEITKCGALESLENEHGGTSRNDGYAGGVKADIRVKDFLPQMKAICEKLEEAGGKVLVISDIKKALGYRNTQGHRAWRNILHRLKEACLVEEYHAKVNTTVVPCLRLVKKFDLNCVQPSHSAVASDDFDTHRSMKLGKQGQKTEQLLELPVEHQIYDLIDAEGSKGLPFVEVCNKLGLNNKKHRKRLPGMVSKFGMHSEGELRKKCSNSIRVWTPGNFTGGSCKFLRGKPGNSCSREEVDQTFHLAQSSASKDVESQPKRLEAPCSVPADAGSSEMLVHGGNSDDLEYGRRGPDYDEEHALSSMINEPISAPLEMPVTTSSKRQLTAESARREQRILERLQEEKFILDVELLKWLESLDKGKRTTMDKKTVHRSLFKLQAEGHCRCIDFGVPLVTNYGHYRQAKVVLHSSLQSLTPALLSQIQERLRSFDMQSHGRGSARLTNDKEVPLLPHVDRILNLGCSDLQAVRRKAMRANGFVPARMVRAKLLHNFLWDFLRNSPDWDDTLYSGRHGYDLKNPHSTCKLFKLDVAIKGMPLELFLQVVGSPQKFEDLVKFCKLGLCLADLPLQEYKSLMDIQARKRLSSLLDILCCMKLTRLVTDNHVHDMDRNSSTVFTYAMELKPYIEEPLSRVSLSLGVSSLDLRPRIKHDFILLTREAVDIYWKTLEYCYATADSKAAVHAFPGSSVHEVFRYRSWAPVRLMTADQRAEHLKRIVRDDPDKKISFSDCSKIARDLNLTMEQVFHVSNDNRQSRVDRYQNDSSFQLVTSDIMSASRRRKRSMKAGSSKHARNGPHEICVNASDDDEKEKATEYLEQTEEDGEENGGFVTRCALKRLKPLRQPKFSWTETSDRQLVVQYARHRAVLGARYPRTNWTSLPDLPAPPAACRRRMHLLNHNPVVRSAVLRLCKLLGERYTRHQAESLQKELLGNNIHEHIIQEASPALSLDQSLSRNAGENPDSGLNDQQWDDFEDHNIKMALDDVLRCKQMAKLESSRSRAGPQKEWPDDFLATQAHDFQEESRLATPVSTCVESQIHDRHKLRRSKCHRLPGKFLKVLNEGINVNGRAYESLAVANAVELLKLVFLSTSLAPEVPSLLAETLRRYSEHDLFAAFNYLREKSFMVGGNGSQPFVLSRRFLHNVSSSPFHSNTGKRAAKFETWLRERERDLVEDLVHLNEELQCGDIYHLLALVSSGELFISPSLPDEGIGEAGENRNVKRKSDNDDICGGIKVKRLKSLSTKEGEVAYRQPKGFPGIKVSLSRLTISKADTMEPFLSGNMRGSPSVIDTGDKGSSSDLGTGRSSPSEIICCTALPVMTIVGSPWEAMTSYGNQLAAFSDKELMCPLNPILFKTAHSTIFKAGDQGLSLEQISQVLSLQGKEMVDFVVNVLQVFGVVVKVNAYDDVRIVDASFRSKYFLTTVEGRYQGLKPVPCVNSSMDICENQLALPEDYNRASVSGVGSDDVHKVTPLNLPEDVSELSNQVQTNDGDVRHEEYMQVEGTASQGANESETVECMGAGVSHSSRPILPWINGDGTTNQGVYKGLVRRVLGIVMQNPGILEDDVIYRMDVLNPQSCRKLLELMILDNHLIVRKMHQNLCSGPPSILGSLCGSSFRRLDSICREHLYANPLSTTLL